jgi:RHH-type proline utilization regulon transcriptional repressor/proline dehydrogenase/delta 1-pyrroline-5-carboxylate dehydrogenase
VQESAEIPLIAETGGQNAMIVDSSALPEQVVQDAISSAFDSAGQRCSALRVLFLQEDIADKTITMLKGAMRELSVGVPDRLVTDIGPVIDAEAKQNLLAHINKLKVTALNHYSLDLPAGISGAGTFVAPTVLEIRSLAELTQEVFGPVLHVIRYKRAELPKLIDQINDSGYGLTLGVHSRIDETIDYISARAHVGNIYVNRNIVGAVVGVQPFGGEGKSGTGPKAGGPLYLKRLQRGAATVATHERQSTPALDALTVWSKQQHHERVTALAEQYSRTSMLGSTTLLPGPTGERNTLSFVARGTVVCSAATTGGLLNQLAAVLASGNSAVVVSGSVLPGDLPAAVKDRIQVVGNLDAFQGDFQVALVETMLVNSVREQLAARVGALVAIIDTNADEAIPTWRLFAERALCVNTTAAGGNASLMTLGV